MPSKEYLQRRTLNALEGTMENGGLPGSRELSIAIDHALYVASAQGELECELSLEQLNAMAATTGFEGDALDFAHKYLTLCGIKVERSYSFEPTQVRGHSELAVTGIQTSWWP